MRESPFCSPIVILCAFVFVAAGAARSASASPSEHGQPRIGPRQFQLPHLPPDMPRPVTPQQSLHSFAESRSIASLSLDSESHVAAAAAVEFEAMPQGMLGHGMVLVAGRLYLVGGFRSEEPLASPPSPEDEPQEEAEQDPDAPETPASSAASPSAASPSAASPSVVSVSDEVVSFALEAGGGIGAVRKETPLPRPLGDIANAVVAYDNRLLLVAGGVSVPLGPLRSDPDDTTVSDDATVPASESFSDRVFFARIGEDGVLADWEVSEPWPGPPLRGTALVAARDVLLVVGGIEPSGAASARVYRARLLPEGAGVGEWRLDPDLPEPRMGHAAVAAGDRVFVLGGRAAKERSPLADMRSAPLHGGGEAPSDEHWARSLFPLPKLATDGCAVFQAERLCWIGGALDGARPHAGGFFTRLREGHPTPWHPLELGLAAPIGGAAALDVAGGRLYVSGGAATKNATRFSNRIGVLALAAGTTAGEFATAPPISRTEARRGSGRETDDPSQVALLSPPARYWNESQAFADARRRERPLFLLVYSSEDEASMQVRETLRTPRHLSIMAGIVLGELDVAADPAAAARYGIESVPTFLLFDSEGALRHRDTQARTLAELVELLSRIR